MESRVRLKSGLLLRSDELVQVAQGGLLIPRRVSDLNPGDWVGLPFGQGFAENQAQLPVLKTSPAYGTQKNVQIPLMLNEDLALLLGIYASEGHTSRQNWCIHITNAEDVVLELCAELWKACFGVEARINRPVDRCPSVTVASKTLVEIFEGLGCGSRAWNKRIPAVVMESPESVVMAFLRGLSLDAFTSTTGPNSLWAICVDSPRMLDDFQYLLRLWGLKSGRTSKYNKEYDKYFDQVTMSGTEAQRFLRAVPFLEPSKTASAERLLATAIDARHNGADVIPIVHGSVLHAGIPKGHSGKGGKGTRTSQWRSLCDARTLWPSRHMVERLAAANFPLPRDVARAISEPLVFSPIKAAATAKRG